MDGTVKATQLPVSTTLGFTFCAQSNSVGLRVMALALQDRLHSVQVISQLLPSCKTIYKLGERPPQARQRLHSCVAGARAGVASCSMSWQWKAAAEFPRGGHVELGAMWRMPEILFILRTQLETKPCVKVFVS